MLTVEGVNSNIITCSPRPGPLGILYDYNRTEKGPGIKILFAGKYFLYQSCCEFVLSVREKYQKKQNIVSKEIFHQFLARFPFWGKQSHHLQYFWTSIFQMQWKPLCLVIFRLAVTLAQAVCNTSHLIWIAKMMRLKGCTWRCRLVGIVGSADLSFWKISKMTILKKKS